jgi:nucleotide-binding universal stress UspA family protein
MMKILLAVDDSRFSEAAVASLARFQITPATRVKVLHIVEPQPLWILGEEPPPDLDLQAARDARTKRAVELLARAAETLRARGASVETVVAEGNPKSKIVDIAAQWPADLIILGSHGWTGLERFLLGSVSEAVVRHAHCSVEVVRAPSET